MTLSDTGCKSAKPTEKAYKMYDTGGLYLHVMPHGTKLWRMKYRYLGKEKTLSLGIYPHISLAQARAGRDQARKLIAIDKDPSFVKRENKRLKTISANNTFEIIARKWHEKNSKAKWTENHSRTVIRRLEIDVFPAIGKLPISDIKTPRLVAVMEKIEKRGAGEIARRSLQYCRAIFAYAKVNGLIENNPADIKASDVLSPSPKGHYAAMDATDLPAFLGKLYRNEARLFRQTQLAMELLMLTFVRTGELIKAQWSEFDFEKKVWSIPAKRMKMKRDHVVPLSKQSLRILEEMKNFSVNRDYVFPSQRDPKSHMSNNSILVALRRMGYGGVHTGHGFRALAMTAIMEELKYPYDVVDLQLAHVKKSDIEAAYNRTKFIKERTAMMQDWADFLESCLKKDSPAAFKS
jgi:integrase